MATIPAKKREGAVFIRAVILESEADESKVKDDLAIDPASSLTRPVAD
jgi:hypothetical protein